MKEKYVLSIIIAILLVLNLILLFSFIECKCKYGTPIESPELYKYSNQVVHKEGNSYFIKEPMNSIVIENKWNNKSINSSFYLYDEQFNIVSEYFVSELNLTNLSGRFYIKRKFIGHFLEGGQEIRYTWALIELDKDSEDTIVLNFETAPAIWRESPDIKW